MCGDNFDVLRVNFRHNHRHVRCLTVSAVVRNNGALSFCISFFQCLNLVLRHIHSAKNKIDLRCNGCNIRSIQHHHVFCSLGHRRRHSPALSHSFFIDFSGGPRRSGNRRQLKPGVIFQQGYKPLANHSCGTNHTCFPFFHLSYFLSYPYLHPMAIFIFCDKNQKIKEKPA